MRGDLGSRLAGGQARLGFACGRGQASNDFDCYLEFFLCCGSDDSSGDG
jgi:hypothetical protein